MLGILGYVFLAFCCYVLAYLLGKYKKYLYTHIGVACVGFLSEAVAISEMINRFNTLQPQVSPELLTFHILTSCCFIVVAGLVVLSGLALYVNRYSISTRIFHKYFVKVFFIFWFLATGTGLLILF